MTRSEEEALMDRDESVAAKLRAHIVGSRERAQQLRDAARSLERQAREESAEADRVEAAARDELWWELSGLLGAETVESLCNCSPSNILDA